jgi:dTMP kinase
MTAPKGLFIVFEGIDGAGKSTQARLLSKHLQDAGLGVLAVKEPGGTMAGDQLRELLLSAESRLEPLTELMLYEASRCQLVQEVIRPALARGQTVISERYALSSLAYQGYGRGLPLELISRLNDEATGGLEPDLTLWIDLPPELGLTRKRGTPDRIERSGLDFYRRIRAGYEALAQGNPKIIRLDGEQSAAALAQQLARHVDPLTRCHVGS